MNKLFYLTAIVFLFVANQTFAQSKEDLGQKIEQIIASKKALVGVSIIGNNGKDKISVNGDKHFPMQSVFKFHIGLFMLSEIDKGKFSLEQKIEIQKKDLLPDLYSPIRDKYPDGATLTVAEILEYTVSSSDNVGCEVLLRLLGGPQAVENYFVKNNFQDVAIKFNEEQQQAN
ncbi:MAG: serine hydrolase, partial [Pyrinomonadaceae bacterium]